MDQRAVMGIAFLLIALATYLVPTMIAVGREHHNRLWIVLLNVFLGWTGLGWLGALLWSLTDVRRAPPPGVFGAPEDPHAAETAQAPETGPARSGAGWSGSFSVGGAENRMLQVGIALALTGVVLAVFYVLTH